MIRYPIRSTLAFAVAFLAAASPAVSQENWRVNVDSSGNEANDWTSPGVMNQDGRWILFASVADNLVPGDTNGLRDIFLHDRLTGMTTRVSVDSAGNEGHGSGRFPDWPGSLSRNGRYAAFQSNMHDLVPGDNNNRRDIFVHERLTGAITRISVSSTGAEGNGDSNDAYMTEDGRHVLFSSLATDLVSNDTNRKMDLFLHDRETGTTTRLSLDSTGNEVNGDTGNGGIYRPDLQIAVFMSYASDLVPNDTNNFADIFVKDLQTGAVTRVNVDSNGNEALAHSGGPSVSGDGNLVVFSSWASNLVPGDTNNKQDVFVHDRQTGTTTRVSTRKSGAQGNGNSFAFFWTNISPDGLSVVFESDASNLLSGDTNNRYDIFTKDLLTGKVRRKSMGYLGDEANHDSWAGRFSGDARFICLKSDATNLVPSDNNGLTDLFVVGPHLTLEADDETPSAGNQLTLTTWRGQPFGATLLAVVAVNGIPTFIPVDLNQFDADGLWSLSSTVPGGLAGNTLTLQAFGKDPTGLSAVTNQELLTFE